MHKSETELTDELRAAVQHVIVGASYAHYKHSDKHYKVLELAITENDDAVCVVYQATYGERITYVRSLESWVSKVEVNGEMTNRFVLVKN